jgi:hypothetical protein
MRYWIEWLIQLFVNSYGPDSSTLPTFQSVHPVMTSRLLRDEKDNPSIATWKSNSTKRQHRPRNENCAPAMKTLDGLEEWQNFSLILITKLPGYHRPRYHIKIFFPFSRSLMVLVSSCRLRVRIGFSPAMLSISSREIVRMNSGVRIVNGVSGPVSRW